MRKAVLACLATTLVVGATSATAASLITGAKVKDRSLTGRDIAKSTIKASNLSKAVRRKLAATGSAQSPIPGAAGRDGAPGAQGPAGDRGPAGADGVDGADGAVGPAGPVASSGSWGRFDESVTGSPVTDLRAGPVSPTTAPPFGQGSLGISARSDEVATYGNRVDFHGDPVHGLSQVGLRLYPAAESAGAASLPEIVITGDPDLNDTHSGSLIFTPRVGLTANAWSGYFDAMNPENGDWWQTVGGMGCLNPGGRCSFGEAAGWWDDGDGEPATIRSISLRTRSGVAWQGAIDGLRINGEVFDFEEHGVGVRAP